MRPSEHPRVAELDRRLLAGEQPALVAEAFPELTAQQVRARKHSLAKRKNPLVDTAAVSPGGAVPSVQIDGDTAVATSRVYLDSDEPDEAELIRGWRLDPNEWEIIDGTLSVNRWVQNAELDTWCYQYKAKLRRSGGVENRLVVPPAVNVTLRTAARLPKRRSTDLGVAVVYEDAQIGYWEDPDTGELHSIHDEAALDISLQVTEDLDAEHGVDELIDIGDTGDNPLLSIRHASAKAFQSIRAMNAGHARIGRLWAERSACAPNARGRVLRGNHEQRWLDYLEAKAPELVGARDAAGELLITIDRMYGISAAGWELVGDSYKDSRIYLNHNTIVEHGTRAGKAAAAAYLTEEINRIFGHTPWAQMSHRTVTTREEPRTYVAAGGGGFMRTTGALPPGIYSGRKEDGKPGVGNAPWQQGFWVVTYDIAGELVPQCEFVMITDGWAQFRGRLYRARCDAAGAAVS